MTAFRAFGKNGYRHLITATDADRFTYSTRLYKGPGMEVYRSEFTFETEIHPGWEVRHLGE